MTTLTGKFIEDLFGHYENEVPDGELTDEDVRLLRCLEDLYERSDKIAIKKLSKNDRAWAWSPSESNQSGIYVPLQFRGCFFPSDEQMPVRQDKPHILQQEILTLWPDISREPIKSQYRRFTNKRSEAHLTWLPKILFAAARPASFLLMGDVTIENGRAFECFIVDSTSTVYSIIEEKFELPADFLAGVYPSPKVSTASPVFIDELQVFIDEIMNALVTGTLPVLLHQYSSIPPSSELSAQAQSRWLEMNPGKLLNPYRLEKPGNVLRELTAGIEFEIYRSHELRMRATRIAEVIFRHNPNPSVQDVITRIVRDFIPLYEIMRDASQQRKTRVGTGFEKHIRTMLEQGGVPFGEQAVVSTRRPDFVLPGVAPYAANSPEALVLAAKTTLRERWKQVPMEQRNCTIFLATMDEKVTRSAVRDMNQLDIVMVVPEAFKEKGTVVEYADEPNVLTFKQFFTEEIRGKRYPIWAHSGLA